MGELVGGLADYCSWAHSIRESLKKAFLIMEAEFNDAHEHNCSGTTLTVALACGWLLTVANLGDTEAVVDTGETVDFMTQNHRLEESPSERDRLLQAGISLARLCPDLSGPAEKGEVGLGPRRCWPGGLANARSIGDSSGGKHILPSPHIKQCVLPSRGCRLIIGSDGVWDSVDHKTACYLARCCTNSRAADRIVTTAIFRNQWSIEDDTTALVVDFLPDENQEFPQIRKKIQKQKRKKGTLFSCFCGSAVDSVDKAGTENSSLMHVAQIDCASFTEMSTENSHKTTIKDLDDSASELSNSPTT